MRIALAQLNPTVGDLRGNAELVCEAAAKARQAGAELLVTSELVISGYPPKDLLLREGFVAACDRAVEELAASLDPGLGVIVGHPTHWRMRHEEFGMKDEGRGEERRGDGGIAASPCLRVAQPSSLVSHPSSFVANAASLLCDGRVLATVHKTLLPNYDVFDEWRYFRPAERRVPIAFRGTRFGIHICEDAWWDEPSTFYHDQPQLYPDPIAELAEAGVDLFVNLSSSPFEVAKPDKRLNILRRHTGKHGVPMVFVNQVGGNDDLVFDGHSMVVDAQNRLVLQLAGFQPDFQIIDTARLPAAISDEAVIRERLILEALILGLGDYARKCGFTDCVLGLSGGIDSSLACYVAARAVGPEHVHGLLMPSRFSTEHSVADARQLAQNLSIDYEIISIDTIHQAYEQTEVIRNDLAGQPDGVAPQNLQARIRGNLVMLRSNRYGWLPLATGNKSELAVGYCTLYGDMAGGFAVLCDVYKRDVYAVSRYINNVVEGRDVIPHNVLTKPPSAELAPDQFDQDDLPAYDVLDAILEGLIEQEASVASLSRDFSPQIVEWVARRLDRNEYKRRQMPPGIKLSSRAFGSGRRMPMAAKFDARSGGLRPDEG